MQESILSMLANSFGAAAGWFSALLLTSSVSGVYLSFVFIWLMYKFLLKPIFGSAGSDTVSKKKVEQKVTDGE